MADFERAIGPTLIREGGSRVTNTPGDAGGTTKYGISKRAYPQLDIANLNEQQAKDIYRRDYWNAVHGDDIASQVIADNIFDTAVNMGNSKAIKLAQLALGIKPADGVLGPQSLAAINGADPNRFVADYTLAKIARYANICNTDRSQGKFLLGWINRAMGALS